MKIERKSRIPSNQKNWHPRDLKELEYAAWSLPANSFIAVKLEVTENISSSTCLKKKYPC